MTGLNFSYPLLACIRHGASSIPLTRCRASWTIPRRGLGIVRLLAPRQVAAFLVFNPRRHRQEMPDGDRLESLTFLEQFGDVVRYGLVNALDAPFVEAIPTSAEAKDLAIEKDVFTEVSS
jgi:hypothetical protein